MLKQQLDQEAASKIDQILAETGATSGGGGCFVLRDEPFTGPCNKNNECAFLKSDILGAAGRSREDSSSKPGDGRPLYGDRDGTLPGSCREEGRDPQDADPAQRIVDIATSSSSPRPAR